jgi:hypothetical protein
MNNHEINQLPQEEKPMQLSYRGQSYTCANTIVKMIDTGLTLKFRGAVYSYSVQKAKSLNLCPLSNLTYRGVAYSRSR